MHCYWGVCTWSRRVDLVLGGVPGPGGVPAWEGVYLVMRVYLVLGGVPVWGYLPRYSPHEQND